LKKKAGSTRNSKVPEFFIEVLQEEPSARKKEKIHTENERYM
jgi:hypothetical protein